MKTLAVKRERERQVQFRVRWSVAMREREERGGEGSDEGVTKRKSGKFWKIVSFFLFGVSNTIENLKNVYDNYSRIYIELCLPPAQKQKRFSLLSKVVGRPFFQS